MGKLTKRKDGSETGLHKLNKLNRDAALKNTDQTTAARKAKGWVWMQKGKTTKQVAPENIEKNLNDNFKII